VLNISELAILKKLVPRLRLLDVKRIITPGNDFRKPLEKYACFLTPATIYASPSHKSHFMKRKTKRVGLTEKFRLDVLLGSYSCCIFKCLLCQHLISAHFHNLFYLHWSSWIMPSASVNSMQNTAIVCVLLVCKTVEGSTHTPGWKEPYFNIFLL